MKNNYWDGAANLGLLGFQSSHKDISSYSLSVFSLCHDMRIEKIVFIDHERCTMTQCSKSKFSLCCDGKKLVA